MARFRCRPGDLARVIYTKNPALLGRTVFVDGRYDAKRWAVIVLGEGVAGTSIRDGRPIFGNDFVFRDSSLLPLRGEEPEVGDHTVSAAGV